MGTFADHVAITCSATAHAEGTAGTIKVPAGARLIALSVTNYLATGGAVYAVRIDFAGAQSPQKYMTGVAAAKEGTEVGTGQFRAGEIAIDVTIPDGVSEISLYPICDTASATCVVGIKWVK